MTPTRANDRVLRARALAERLRRRELERAVTAVTVTAADPDAREAVATSIRMIWPPGAVLKFMRARVISSLPVRLYDDVPAGVVRPAAPINR